MRYPAASLEDLLITAVLTAGFAIEHLAEHPHPFWRPAGVQAAAWDGRLPNAYRLLGSR